MTTVQLTDEQWAKLRDLLRSDPYAYLGTAAGACRRCVEAVLWIDRSGAQWRVLPTAYGTWKSGSNRCARWCEQRVWARLLAHCANDPEMEHGILDSTIVRAHPCAAGAENNGTADEQALGRSGGGCSTKIPSLVDGVGNPLRVRLTAGQCPDSPPAPAVLEGLTCARVLADRGYAGQAFSDRVVQGGAAAVIPAHQRAQQPRDSDRWW
jgi:transposase